MFCIGVLNTSIKIKQNAMPATAPRKLIIRASKVIIEYILGFEAPTENKIPNSFFLSLIVIANMTIKAREVARYISDISNMLYDSNVAILSDIFENRLLPV